MLAYHRMALAISNRSFTPGCSKWVAPPMGHFKVNFDANLGSGSDGFRIGVVIWDDKGKIFVSMCKFCDGSPLVNIVELKADFEEVIFVVETGF